MLAVGSPQPLPTSAAIYSMVRDSRPCSTPAAYCAPQMTAQPLQRLQSPILLDTRLRSVRVFISLPVWRNSSPASLSPHDPFAAPLIDDAPSDRVAVGIARVQTATSSPRFIPSTVCRGYPRWIPSPTRSILQTLQISPSWSSTTSPRTRRHLPPAPSGVARRRCAPIPLPSRPHPCLK